MTATEGQTAALEQTRTVSERFDQFVTLISQINRSIRRIKGYEMRSMGLRGVHVMILFHLNLEPEGLTQSELVTLCDEDKATISRAVQDLTEKGIIAQVSSPSMHRNVKLALTPKGDEVARDLNHRVKSAVDAGGATLDEGDRCVLYRLLAKVSENLSAYLAQFR